MLKNVTVIPELALQQNEVVYLLNDGKLTAKPVRIIERKKGEVFVTGLNAKAVRVCDSIGLFCE